MNRPRNGENRIATDAQLRKMMTDMGMTVRYMDGKQAGTFWDELEAQTKPLVELAK